MERSEVSHPDQITSPLNQITYSRGKTDCHALFGSGIRPMPHEVSIQSAHKDPAFRSTFFELAFLLTISLYYQPSFPSSSV